MRLRLLLAAFAGLLAGCASTDSAAPASSTKRVTPGLGTVSEVTYSPAHWPRALRANLYQPKGDGPWPGVLLIYGGSWNSADHRWQMKLLARKLAARGFVVMVPAYRGTPDFHFPAPIEDLREALRWWRGHAGEYRLRGDAIAAYGFSAGGHLAAFIGMHDAPPEVRVQAVVAASAPTVLTLYPNHPVPPQFLGATYAENPRLYAEASPVTHVTPDDPPVFQYHGTADQTVSPNHTKVFKAALDRAGVRNDLRWLEGRGHASVLVFGGAAEDAAIAFLDSVLR